MEVQQQFGDQVTFVGVPSLADESSIAGFVADQGVTAFSHIPDLDGDIWQRFNVRQQRTYVIINDDGEWYRTGYGDLQSNVEELIAT